jgi:hypothetical protein
MAVTRIANTSAQAIPQPGTTHFQQTVAGTAIPVLQGITVAANTEHFLVQVLGASIRVTFDGTTNPTASLGYQFPVGTSAYWSRGMAERARAIREGGTSATLEIQQLNFF